MKKKSLWFWLFIIFIIVLTGYIIYILNKTLFITIIIIFLIILVIVLFLRQRKKDTIDLEIKRQVDSVEAMKVWKESFIVQNNIPHHYIYDENNQRIVQINGETSDFKLMVINNERPYIDKETADNFRIFDLYCKVGDRQGNFIVLFRTDNGVEHIRKNCMFFFKNGTQNLSKLRLDEFPITSLQDKKDRLEMAKLRLMEEEGLTQTEAGDVVSAYQPTMLPIQPKNNDAGDLNNNKNKNRNIPIVLLPQEIEEDESSEEYKE